MAYRPSYDPHKQNINRGADFKNRGQRVADGPDTAEILRRTEATRRNKRNRGKISLAPVSILDNREE